MSPAAANSQYFPLPPSIYTLVGLYFSQTSMIFAADFALGCLLWQVVHKAVHGS